MHTNTFQSRFKVGDKITNGTTTFTITKIAIDAHSVVYYRTQERTYPEERNLTNYRLAPKYPIGSKVWIIADNAVVETVVTSISVDIYQLDNSYIRTVDQIFPTSTEALAAIKIIPLET